MKRNCYAQFKKYLSYLFVITFIIPCSPAIGETTSTPWLVLLLDDKIQQGETKAVSEEGGVLTFKNGLILDIPAGAVTELTNITVKDVKCQIVDPILSAYPFTSHEKRCIGGFSAEPDGFVFNKPIKATVPVLPLDPGESPIQFETNLDAQNYWITETDLVYQGTTNTIELSIQHFSDYWWAAMGNHIDEVCSNCSTWDDPYFKPACESLDQLQPSCCLLKPAERARCAPSCLCCRELIAKIKSAGVDSSYGNCQIVGGEVEVTYPECAGFIESFSMSEASKECPKDLCADISGSWSGSWSEISCDDESYSGSWTAEVTVDCTLKGSGIWAYKRGTINPFTLVLKSGGISEDGCGFFSLTGAFRNNDSLSGSYSYSDGGGGSFSGHKQ